MSPHVGNFVQDLVEMAKATEMLPQVQAELAQARATEEELRDRVMDLELKLLDRATEIERLNEAVRQAEVSRDDAELRFLEADDVANRVHRKVADVEAVLRSMAADLEGLKPKLPEPEPQVEEKVHGYGGAPTAYEAPPSSWGQSEAHPPAPSAHTSGGPSGVGSPPAQPEVATTTGQAEGGVSTGQSASPLSGASAPSQDSSASANPDGARNSVEADRPYAGKLYMGIPGWISRDDWKAGGGTDETYDWRVGKPLPEGVAA